LKNKKILFQCEKKLLSNLNLCDYDGDSIYEIFNSEKKYVSFFSSKISLYPNIDSLSEKDVDNKIVDLIKINFIQKHKETLIIFVNI
jgi:hypothetical protein